MRRTSQPITALLLMAVAVIVFGLETPVAAQDELTFEASCEAALPTDCPELRDEWDTDEDGILDADDPDDDNDGVPDVDDGFPTDPYRSADSDGDGMSDQEERRYNIGSWRGFDVLAEEYGLDDRDGDGKWDADEDADGDGYHDAIDPSLHRPPPEACWSPEDSTFELIGPSDSDYDLDGQPDSVDQDFDNDGIVDEYELELMAILHDEDSDTDGDGVVDREDDDLDGDGFINSEDQFPFDSSEWIDFDCGGLGDNADPDDDDDGVFDEDDPFPYDGHEWLDTDADGIGNNLDADDDNDGALDSVDAFPEDSTEMLDTDYDGIGNNADRDDDDDGVLDEDDAFPLDWLYSRDSDADGEGDYAELRQNNPELVAAIESTFGGGQGSLDTARIRSQQSSSGGSPPWRLIRILVVWPVLGYAVYKGRQG